MITHLEGDSPTQPLINIEAIPLLNGPPHDVFCHGIWYDRLRPGCYKVYNCGVSDYFGVGHHRDGGSRGFDGVECEVISGHNTFFLQSVSAHLHVCPWTYLYGYYHLEPTLLTIQAFEAQLSYAPSEKFCSQRMLYSTILGISSAAVVQCVLVTRTHALYQQRWLTIFLGILGFLSISSAFILFSLVFRFETFTPASTFGLRGCILGCTNGICKSMLIGFWIPFVLFETIIFGLTGWKTYKSLNSSARFSRFPSVITILFRDGLVYYIVMMSLSVCNFLIWIADPYASYLAVGFF